MSRSTRVSRNAAEAGRRSQIAKKKYGILWIQKEVRGEGCIQKGFRKTDDVIISVGAGIKSTVSVLTGSNTSANDSKTCSSKINIAERSLGERPIGYTKETNRRNAEEVVKAKNEITQRMMEAREIAKRNNERVKNGFMSE